MSANLLAIYCLILSAKRLRAEELSFERIYNSVIEEVLEVPTSVWISILLIVSIALILIIVWLMCWCFDESSESDELSESGEGSPNLISPIIVHNQSQPRIVSIQRTVTTKPKGIPKGSVNTEVLRSPMKGVSIRLEEQSEKGQSIANNSEQTTGEVKNETQEKSNAKNTIVLLNSTENIVSTSNQTSTTGGTA